MFIVFPTNVDYLIQDIRLRIGDLDATRLSDSIVRTAIISAVKSLQRRWGSRYLVFDPSALTPDVPAPSGYVSAFVLGSVQSIPSGLAANDVFRNPVVEFSHGNVPVISQEDEYAVVLAASIILRKSQLTSSAETFQIWSDGQYSFSNASKANALSGLTAGDEAELERLFKARLAGAVRGSFGRNHARIY
jgi:hypothetical protein